MPKMIEISAAEYERLQDCIREDGMRIAALIEENKALHQDAKRLTAVEAAPVVHGRWIGEADGYADGEMVYDVWNCSKCDYCIDDGTDNPELLPNYCPNCGAKMDGEGEPNGK